MKDMFFSDCEDELRYLPIVPIPDVEYAQTSVSEPAVTPAISAVNGVGPAVSSSGSGTVTISAGSTASNGKREVQHDTAPSQSDTTPTSAAMDVKGSTPTRHRTTNGVSQSGAVEPMDVD